MSAIGVFNLTERWRHGLKSSFRKRLSDGQDFSYINVGDSVATGRIGIPNKSQHYAAVAARTAARHLGLPCRLALHTADDLGTDDRVGLSGRGWRIEEGGLYGGGSCIVDAGGEGVLNYFPEPRCRMVRISIVGDSTTASTVVLRGPRVMRSRARRRCGSRSVGAGMLHRHRAETFARQTTNREAL